jgi:hypothetical protein
MVRASRGRSTAAREKGGKSTVDWSSDAAALDVTLTAPGASQGFAGTEPATIGKGFNDIDTMLGGTGVDTLTGLGAAANWNLPATGPNTYSSTNTLTFSGFDNLAGGTVSDKFSIAGPHGVSLSGGGGVTNFVFADGSSVVGSVDGGTGASTVDWSTVPTARNVVLTSMGTSHGLSGTEASIGSFTNIDVLKARTGVGNALAGVTNAAGIWTLPATGADTYASTNTLTFTGFTYLIGGMVSDSFSIAGTQNVSLTGGGGAADFVFTDGAKVTGAIVGGTGQSTLDWSAFASARQVTLTSPGTSQGFAGSEASIGGGFTDIDGLVGAAGSTLAGTNAVATWNLPASGPDTYSVSTGTATLSFSGFTLLAGGKASDTFSIAGTQKLSLTGGGGIAAFVFANGASVTGTIDGGAGASTLDWTHEAAAPNVTLTRTGPLQGFAGAEPASVPGGFTDIGNLIAPATAGGTLTGMPNGIATWSLPGALDLDTYSITTSSNILSFVGFTQLVGGTTADTFAITGTQPVSLKGGGGVTNFVFADGSSVIGTVDGGAGKGTVDWSAYATSRDVKLTPPGGSHGFAGNEASIGGGFTEIDNLLGGTGANMLTGLNSTAIWKLPASGPNTYTSTNTLAFSGFTNLVGGSASDTFNILGSENVSLSGGGGAVDFVFSGAGSITGTIEGGTGSSTLDWSAVPTARNVVLTSLGALHGFDGTESSIGGGFADIDVLKGRAINGSSLTGLDASATWTLPATGPGNYASTKSLTFSGFAQLVGGTVSDTFNIAGTQNLSLSGGGGAANFHFGFGSSVLGTVDGGAGAGSIVGPNSVTAWTISGPNAGQVSFITGGFTNISSITGGSGANTYTFTGTGSLSGDLVGGSGKDSANEVIDAGNGDFTWNVTGIDSGNVPLIGGSFQHIGSLDVGAGTDSVILTQPGYLSGFVKAEGTNDFIQADGSLWTITGPNIGISSDFGLGFSGFGYIEDSAVGDTFIFAGGSLSGQLIGLGFTTVQWTATPGPITLTAATPVGFSGTVPGSIGNGFLNVGRLIAPGGGTLTGAATVATWDLASYGVGTYTAFSNPERTALIATLSYIGFTNLVGGGVSDLFQFGNGGIAGSIDGGVGASTLDWSDDAVPLSVRLTGLSGVGFAGSEGTSVATFTNIDSLVGNGTVPNTLTGTNVAAAWSLGTTNTYTYGNTLTFTGFTNLVGGTGDDVFDLEAAFAGSIDGGAGNNTLEGGKIADVTLTGSMANGYAGTLKTTTDLTGGFKNIGELIGTGTLTGENLASTWTLAEAGQTYSDNTGTGLLTFSGFDALFGGTDANTFQIDGDQAVSLFGGEGTTNFVFGDGASVTGTVVGGAGTSTLDWSADTTAPNVALSGPGSVHGFEGTEALSIGGGFDNIDTLVGQAFPFISALTGLNALAIWTLGANDANTFEADGRTLTFSGFMDLVGGGGTDTFRFNPGAKANGFIDGGAGTSTLDWSAYAAALNVTLTGTGVTHGFEGTEPGSIGGDFTDIDKLIGSASVANTLTGTNDPSTWNLGTSDTYTSTTPNTLTFSGFTTLIAGDAGDLFTVTAPSTFNLLGGAGNDAFDLEAALTGSVDGGAGNNTLKGSQIADVTLTGSATDGYSGTLNTTANLAGGFSNIRTLMGTGTLTGENVASNWILAAAGQTYADNANNGLLTFSGFTALQGGTDTDTFTLGADLSPGLIHSIDGGTGTNTLNGPSSDTAWMLTGTNSGNLSVSNNNLLTSGFKNIQILVGGQGNDTFGFQPGAEVAWSIDGGAGNNTLDWSADTTAPQVVLTDLGRLNGFKGKEPFTMGGTFDDIDNLSGPTVLTFPFDSKLTGMDAAATWNLGANAQNTYTVVDSHLGFTGFTDLAGGGDTDTFQFADDAKFNGSIDGGAGASTLDWTNDSKALKVALSGLGTLHGFAGTEAGSIGTQFDNIDTVKGGTGANTLTGLASPAVWNMGTTDTYTNTNILTFAGFGTLVAGETAGIPGDQFFVTALGTFNLVGGAGNDVFQLDAALTGSIDGGAGTNTLRGGKITNVTLTGSGPTGYAGTLATATDLSGGFKNVRTLRGTGRLTGDDKTSLWTIAAASQTYDDQQPGNGALTFSGFSDLKGGAGADTFTLATDVSQIPLSSVDGGGGLNALYGPDVDTSWALTGTNSGNLSVNGVNLLTAGFTNVEGLVGGSGRDTFTLNTNANLSALIDGGEGDVNTIQGPDTNVTWTTYSQGLGPDRAAFNAATSKITGAGAGGLTVQGPVAPYVLETGQPVVFQASAPSGNLVPGTTYYVIVPDPVNNPTSIQLAASPADAFSNPAVPIATGGLQLNTNPTLTNAVTFANIQGLTGGAGNNIFVDALAKQANQALGGYSGSVLHVDGGVGTNQLQTQVVLAPNAAIQPTDGLYWGVTGLNSGWQADPNAAFLMTRQVAFDQTALGPDQQSLNLPANGLSTGQAVVYHVLTGGTPLNIVGGASLTDNQLLYVIKVDENTIRLTATAGGPVLKLAAPAGTNRYTFTAIDARGNDQFTDAAVNQAASTISMPNAGFQSGQAVVYRAVTNAGAPTESIGGLTSDTVYYVIANGNTIQLANSFADALANIPVTFKAAPAAGTLHSLTPVFGFGNVAFLTGDLEHDTFGLLNGGITTGALDGGGGTNSLQVRLPSGAAATLLDALVWGVTGSNTGGLADESAQFLADRPYTFDQSSVKPVIANQPGQSSLTLPGNDFATGQAVIFHVLQGASIPELTQDTTVYYVIRVDANTIKLTTNPNDLNDGMSLTNPGGTNSYLLTAISSTDAIDAGSSFIFAGGAVKPDSSITVPGQDMQTGQAVLYRAGNGNAIGPLTNNTVYYVIANPIAPEEIKLAATFQNALTGNAIENLTNRGTVACIRSRSWWASRTSPTCRGTASKTRSRCSAQAVFWG